MSDIEKVTGASPSLAHEPGPAPVAGTARGFTADDHTYLEAQVDEITGVLVGRGYLDIAQTPAEAVREMAADAAEARRAREVLFADEVLEEEYDIAEALREATDLAAEHQQTVELLCHHDIMTGGEPLPEAVQILLSTVAETERARELLLDDGRMQDDENVPGAVQVLIAETGDVRKLLINSGYMSWEVSRGSSWDPTPAEALQEVIKTAEAAEELRKLCGLQQQGIQDLATLARRALTTAHINGHSGEIHACADCAPDWGRLHLLAGFSV
jgi:hypothetical protein